MLMSTTTVLEGKPVSRYLGVVTGEAIIGANIFRDMFATVRDIVGGRSATYERGLAEARQTALAEMERRAQELGANAVIGIDLDYEVLGQNNGMLMVSVSGTAVVCATWEKVELESATASDDCCSRGRLDRANPAAIRTTVMATIPPTTLGENNRRRSRAGSTSATAGAGNSRPQPGQRVAATYGEDVLTATSGEAVTAPQKKKRN